MKNLVLNVTETIAFGILNLFSIALGVFAFGCIVYTAFLALTETY